MAPDRTPPDQKTGPDDVTSLANERTFAAWLRTGLAAMAVGIGFERLFPDIHPLWLARAGATLLVVLAMCMFATSFASYLQGRRRLHRESFPNIPMIAPALFATLSIAAAAVSLAVMWHD